MCMYMNHCKILETFDFQYKSHNEFKQQLLRNEHCFPVHRKNSKKT